MWGDDDEDEDGPSPRRAYWAERHGKQPDHLDAESAAGLFANLIASLTEQGSFQQWFGYYCVDNDDVPGKAGTNLPAYALRKTFRNDMWPVNQYAQDWDEPALLTAVEFYHDHVSAGVDGRYHSWNNCGMHYQTFDRKRGRAEYRTEVNSILSVLGPGYTLDASGEVVRAAPSGMTALVDDEVPTTADSTAREHIQSAIRKFRSRQADVSDRRDAVRDLAGVLEYLRPQAKRLLSKADESDLFDLANNYTVRHLNQRQKADFDQEVWYEWMFYTYLATIRALLRVIESERSTP